MALTGLDFSLHTSLVGVKIVRSAIWVLLLTMLN
jgi:hypothetical protein